MAWTMPWLLFGLLLPLHAHDVELLPYLLGTTQRPQELLDKWARDDRRKFREATCALGAVGLGSNLARMTYVIRNIVNSCPQSAEDSLSYQPGEEASLPIKVCLLSTTALVANLAQVARSLTVLISTCERSATIEEGCAASVETLLVPASLFINGGIAISAACDKGAVDLPKDIQPGRRLLDPTRLPKKRQWDIAQCTTDAVDAARSVAALGLVMDSVGRACPADRSSEFNEKLTTAGCAVDVSVLLTAFTRLVFYLALAVNHCSPEPERDAICLVGVTAIAAGGLTTSAGGAGAYASCTLKRQRKIVEQMQEDAADADEINRAPFNIVRLKRRLREMKDVEDLWLSWGYNLSDANADWLHETESPEMLEVRAQGEDFRRSLEKAPELPEAFSWPSVSEGVECPGPLAPNHAPAGAVALTSNASECQGRCFRTPGCLGFAFWHPGGHCHVLGHLRLPVSGRPWGEAWTTGPAACELTKSQRRLQERHRSCYHAHAMYEKGPWEPRLLASPLECQAWCELEASCLFFSYFTPSGVCHLSAEAKRLEPVLNFVSGPKSCSEIEEFTLRSGRLKPGQGALLGLSLLATLATCARMLYLRIAAQPYAAAPLDECT